MKICKKYGLFTAVALVAGTVIGSGVFFKSEAVLRITQGNVFVGLLSWVAGGACMISSLLSFAVVFAGAKGADNLSEVAGKTLGDNYSYYLNLFMNSVYYPSLVAVLAYLSARYILQSVGAFGGYNGSAFLLSLLLLAMSFAENTFCPEVSGKVQKITTFIKLLPLFLMIFLGTGNGIANGILEMNFMTPARNDEHTFFASVSAVLFAYEGWIGAMCIGPDLKNSKRNLPLALILGGGLVVFVYVFYYIGIMGSVSSETLLNYGVDGIKTAFSSVVGKKFSNLLFLFVSISCIGALNGMSFALQRSIFSVMKKPVPQNLFWKGVGVSLFWLIFLFKTEASDFGFDISEIPVVTLYVLYIPIFIAFLRKNGKSISVMRKAVVINGIIASAFTAVCAFYTHLSDMPDYVLILSGFLLWGIALKKESAKH